MFYWFDDNLVRAITLLVAFSVILLCLKTIGNYMAVAIETHNLKVGAHKRHKEQIADANRIQMIEAEAEARKNTDVADRLTARVKMARDGEEPDAPSAEAAEAVGIEEASEVGQAA